MVIILFYQEYDFCTDTTGWFIQITSLSRCSPMNVYLEVNPLMFSRTFSQKSVYRKHGLLKVCSNYVKGPVECVGFMRAQSCLTLSVDATLHKNIPTSWRFCSPLTIWGEEIAGQGRTAWGETWSPSPSIYTFSLRFRSRLGGNLLYLASSNLYILFIISPPHLLWLLLLFKVEANKQAKMAASNQYAAWSDHFIWPHGWVC